MAQDYEAPPPGFKWASDTSGNTSVRWLEPIPQDRSIPNVTPEGELIPTPPTIDQMRYELSQQKTPADLGDYLMNLPTEIRDQAMALSEMGAGLFGGMASQGAAALTGVGKNIYDLIAEGKIDPKATDEAANRAAQLFSYQPVMPSAQHATEVLGETLGQLPPVVSGINPRAMTLPQGTLEALKAGVTRDIGQFGNDIFNAQRGITPGYSTAGSEFSRAFVSPQPSVYELLAGAQPSEIPSTVSMAVRPKGNLNFTPNIKSETFKGPETQTVSSFINQLSSIPGMTASGLEYGLEKLRAMEPSQKITKSAIEDQLTPSQYEKVDLRGKSNGDIEHYFDQALDNIDMRDVLNSVGVPPSLHSAAQDFLNGDVDAPPAALRPLLRRNGWLDRDIFEDRVLEIERDMAYEQARDFAAAENSGRGYEDIQRLIDPDYTEGKYFEIGVTDPRYKGEYRHYEGAPEGTIGHIRGSFLPEPYMEERVPIEGSNYHHFGINDPGAMLIEEIQSDANKGVKQTGPLHQVHGILFKAAIQHALENGAKTVYMPTSKPIANVRAKLSSAYAPIYDQQIVKEGINPLKKIPGVIVTDVFDDGGENHMMYKIDFTPEAIKHILKGEGQKLPGYADGGIVAALDKMVKDPQAQTMLNVDIPTIAALSLQAKHLKSGGKVFKSSVKTADLDYNLDDMRHALAQRKG